MVRKKIMLHLKMPVLVTATLLEIRNLVVSLTNVETQSRTVVTGLAAPSPDKILCSFIYGSVFLCYNLLS